MLFQAKIEIIVHTFALQVFLSTNLLQFFNDPFFLSQFSALPIGHPLKLMAF